MKNKSIRIAVALVLLLTVANLVGGILLLTNQDSEVSLLAKRPTAPKPPEPDHGPTLPPDPWEPI